MNLISILLGAALIIGLSLLLGWLNKANGTDSSSLCCGDCSGCRQSAGCSDRKPDNV